MTNSTIDDKSGDGGFDVGTSVDDLFGAIADEPHEDVGVDRGTVDTDDEETNETDETDTIEDETAANVFGQLKADAETVEGDGSADDVLEGATPEDIIASADEPAPEPESTIDDDLLADEDELAALLLTGRTKEAEFLWVDPGSDAETDPAGDEAEAESNAADVTASEPVIEADDEASETNGTSETNEADDAEVALELSETGDTGDDTEANKVNDASADDGVSTPAQPAEATDSLITDAVTDGSSDASVPTTEADETDAHDADDAGDSDDVDEDASSTDDSTDLLGWIRSKL